MPESVQEVLGLVYNFIVLFGFEPYIGGFIIIASAIMFIRFIISLRG